MASSAEAVDLRDFSESEFICLQKGKSLRKLTDWYCHMAGFEPTVILESDSPEVVRSMIHAGIGIAFVPSITWSGMESETVSLHAISFPQCRRYINLSWHENTRLSPAAILFRDWLRTYFDSLEAV